MTPRRMRLLFFLFLFLFLLVVSPFLPALVVQLPFSVVSKRNGRRFLQILDVVHEQREERAEDEYDRESDAKVQDVFLLPLRVVFAFTSSEC